MTQRLPEKLQNGKRGIGGLRACPPLLNLSTARICEYSWGWRRMSIRANIYRSLHAAIAAVSLCFLHGVDQLGDHLKQISDDAIVRDLEDRRVRVFINRDHRARALHSDEVLDRAGDSDGQIHLW